MINEASIVVNLLKSEPAAGLCYEIKTQESLKKKEVTL